MNKHNDWKTTLSLANESLATIGYSIEVNDDEDKGCYSCKILTEGYVVETYAENYYEEELSDLIIEVWHYIREKYRNAETEVAYCYEHCPHCDAEVALKAEFGVQTCPNCGKRIPTCSMCLATDANDGKNYCSNCCLCYQAERENEEKEREQEVIAPKKRKYSVEVCRTGYGFATIEVEAESEEEAEDLAIEKAGNYDYSEKDADYLVESVRLA